MLAHFIEKEEFDYLYDFHMNKKYNYFFINLENDDFTKCIY